MAKGSPNGADRKLNFVAKVYDPTADDYVPIYIAPEATNTVLGDVLLSDAVNSTDNAATGITAATPAAVKAVNDNANNKLDKTTATAQTVKSDVAFTGEVSSTAGFKGNLTGNVTGNASTATKLATPRTISVAIGNKSGSATFDGSASATITMTKVDATALDGLVPLASIPQGALERLVKVANETARFALTTANVQLGDTVLQTDTGVMYVVVDEANLGNAAGYQEYKASTALKANEVPWTGVTGKTNATTTAAGLMSAEDKVKLNGIASGAEVNQNAFSNVVVAGTTLAADSKTDTLTITAGSNVTLTPTAASDSFVIAAKDTTYNVMTGANGTAAGASGLVPAPAATDNVKFLRGDGTWQVAGEVTGVKGNAETTYRTGNVNLTPANIGALSTSGGTVTGTLTLTRSTDLSGTANNGPALIVGGAATAAHMEFNANEIHAKATGTTVAPLYLNNDGGSVNVGSGGLVVAGTSSLQGTNPATTNTYSLGTNALKWSNVYATTFTGNLTGNVTGNVSGTATSATTANRLNKTLQLTGNVTGSVNLNADGTSSLATTIADKAVTNGKLADDVGTVYVGATEPTEAHVKLWVKI